MKSKLFIVWLCCLLVVSNQLMAEIKEGIKKNNRVAVKSKSNPAVANHLFTCLPDTIILTTQAQINNFSTTYPTCTNPKYLFIDGTGASPAITNLTGLGSITQIINKLVISNTSITSLSALTNLTYVGDALNLEHNSLLTSIGLNNLTQLGSIIFRDLPLLTNIAGLSNHISSTGIVVIDSTALTSLAGLSGITNINGEFHLGHSPIANLNSIANLSVVNGSIFMDYLLSFTSVGLNNLTQVNDIQFINVPMLTSIAGLCNHLGINNHINNLWIINTALTNLQGLDSLNSMNHFTIWSNPNLTSLHGLEQLTGNNQYGFSIYDNNALTDITALGNITSVSEGTTEFANNGSLTDLTGIGNITTIGGGLKIIGNQNLTSLEDFNNSLMILSGNGDSVEITDNNMLAVCSSAPICNYLAANGPANIHDNASGCNSITEVQATCNVIPACSGGILKTWNGNVSIYWDTAANWTPVGVPQPCDTVLLPSGRPVYPQLGGITIIKGLIMQAGSNLDCQFAPYVDINGDISMDSASISFADSLNVNSPHNVHLNNSVSIFGNYFLINNYDGPLEITNCVFDSTLKLTDNSTRVDAANINNNHINGSLFVTTNTTNSSAVTNISATGDNDIFGNTVLTANSPVPFNIGNGGNGKALRIKGNLLINSNIAGYPALHNIIFDDHVNTRHITQLGTAPLYIDSVSLPGVLVIPDNNLHINKFFRFHSGRVKSDINKVLIFENNTTWSIFNSGSYVWGPVKKIGNQPFFFPTGDSLYQRPFAMTAPVQPTDAFTAQYNHINPSLAGYDTSLHASSLSKILAREYWKFDRNNGNSKVKLSFNFDTSQTGPITSPYDLRIARWNGSQWENLGNGGIEIFNNISGRIHSDSISSFGPLALALAPHRIPVITIANADSVACVGSNFKVHFSVDTLMISNNVFTAQLSDSSGSFASPYNLGSIASNRSDSIFGFITGSFSGGNNYKVRIIGNAPPDTSIAKTISIKPFPSSNIVVNGPAVACYGGGVYKYWVTPAQPGIIYNWNINAGDTITSNYDTAYVRFGYIGSHSVSVVNANVCRTGTLAYLGVVVTQPAPTAAPLLNNTGRWLYASAPAANQNAAGYRWFRNDTLISGAANNSYYAAAAGSYKVKYYNLCNDGPASNVISFGTASIPQTINFPVIANKTYGDAPFVPSATATSGLPVSFSVVSGAATINAQTNILTITGTGVITVRANQVGNNVYDTAAPVTRNFTVNKAAQVITFAAIPNQDISNGTVTLSASSTSSLPISYSIMSGFATVAGNTMTLTGVGTVTMRASQTGDTNYLPAANVDQSFCTNVANLNTVMGYTNLCPGTATYTINNIPGATYLWRIAGGSTLPSTTNSANVTWVTPGTYSLIVSASGNCGAASNNDTLVVQVISSIQPDSVQNMLPANGAINLPLPLTLSWVPAQPANFYTFDLYVWRADLAQPTTPWAANLTSVNYTLTVSSGLLSNTAYKWMVVAHNGSCTQINTGPVQQFTLIPLPDLKIQNVQAPATAFSGQSIAINWTVKNLGPGNTNTNQNWTDAVFLSFDTIPNFTIPPNTFPGAWSFLDFPVRPLLIGTRPNVSALDSGQQYSNSISFTLPVNYSQPLYVYVITNYPAGVNAPQQISFVNDTARAAQPVIVTLSPTPDLRVDTVFTPNTTFSGSTINLTYKVKNHGVLTAAGAAWVDKIYISQSPFFNINTAIPVKIPKANGTYYANAVDAVVVNSVQLLADSFYTRNMQVVVPNFIFGAYFIYVFTDADNTLYEGSLDNNNTNRTQLQVFITPTPHLTVSSLTVPVTTASTTQPIGVNWNISNTGFNDNIEKNKGHFYVYNTTCIVHPPCPDPGSCTLCTCPPEYPGINFRDSVSFGSSYWIDKVYLSTDSNGLNINTAILVNQTAQGTLNSGLIVPDNYNNPLALECKNIGSTGSIYNVNTGNVIKPSSNHPSSGNFIIPANLPAGNYYVYVLTDANNDVYEYPGLPETRRSALPITIQQPDAVVSAVTVPGTASGGQPVNINYSVLNNGPGVLFNQFRIDDIYVSTSAVFDASAQLINTLSYVENLPVGTAVPHSLSYTFPVSTSGTRYFYVRTNTSASFSEININNNISSTTASSIVVVAPGTASDLIVTSITLADTMYAVYPTNFKYTVHNNGPGSTAGAAWIDSIFISCSPVYNTATSHFFTRTFHNNIVTAGSNYTDSFNLNFGFAFDYNNCFPQAYFNNAYFFVKTNANQGLYEGANTNNNVNGTGSKVVVNTMVDHIVTTVTAPDSAISGRPYLVNWTVKNIGYNPANYNYYGSTWYDGVYFSTDSVLNANAVSASYNSEGTVLNTNQTYNDSKTITVPNLPTGDYYVFVFTNAGNTIYAERVLTNNSNLIRNGVGAPIKVHSTQPVLPDLRDTILSASAIVATGQPLTLVHKVSNKGSGATYPANWSDAVWLSADFIPGNTGDILISAKNHVGVLQPNQSYTDTTTAIIALNAAPGNYVLISQVNATGNVFESNTNNNLGFRYVTIYSPAPADLIVENVIKPDTVLLGYTLDTAKWVVKNMAANAAVGISSDGIYLSQSNVLDSTAVLLGIINKIINMAPLATDTVGLAPLVNNIPEGNYNVLVKTDLLNNIVESNKNNNTGVALTQIYVKVKELPLNVLTANTLGNVNRFYKLIVPDSLNGATILVALKTGDSLSRINQMFIGKNYIPSAAHFDYTYSTPNYGNQDIVMTSVTPGVYYISIRCVSANQSTQNITLKAVKLPFTILNVHTNSGGNIGNVTIKISGSLFTNNMSAKLTKPGTVIIASSIYYSNSTTVYATFNLQGKPLGIYDVTLTKPDTSMAVLLNGFSVVPANNGGLNNGGGTNTGAGNGNAPGCDPGASGGINSQLVVEVAAPDKVFAGWPFIMQINYNNPTNVDIPAQVRILYSQMGIKMALTPEGVDNGTTALYLELTEQNGPPGIIRAGGSGFITVYAKAPLTVPAHAIALFSLK